MLENVILCAPGTKQEGVFGKQMVKILKQSRSLNAGRKIQFFHVRAGSYWPCFTLSFLFDTHPHL